MLVLQTKTKNVTASFQLARTQKITIGLARHLEKTWQAWQDASCLAMIVHDHNGFGEILPRSCQHLGKHIHASWQAYHNPLHWEDGETS